MKNKQSAELGVVIREGGAPRGKHEAKTSVNITGRKLKTNIETVMMLSNISENIKIKQIN